MDYLTNNGTYCPNNGNFRTKGTLCIIIILVKFQKKQ